MPRLATCIDREKRVFGTGSRYGGQNIYYSAVKKSGVRRKGGIHLLRHYPEFRTIQGNRLPGASWSLSRRALSIRPVAELCCPLCGKAAIRLVAFTDAAGVLHMTGAGPMPCDSS